MIAQFTVKTTNPKRSYLFFVTHVLFNTEPKVSHAIHILCFPSIHEKQNCFRTALPPPPSHCFPFVYGPECVRYIFVISSPSWSILVPPFSIRTTNSINSCRIVGLHGWSRTKTWGKKHLPIKRPKQTQISKIETKIWMIQNLIFRVLFKKILFQT